DFLGFTFRYYEDLQGRGWRYLNVSPSAKALKKEREKLHEMTDHRQCFKPIPQLIEGLNRHLKGWKNYFDFGYPRQAFRDINWYVRGRLTQLQLAAQAGHVVAHRPAAMITASIQDQKDGPRGTVHEAAEKLRKHGAVDPAPGQHETQLATRAYRRDHIDRTALAAAPHHRGLALDPPGRSRVTVAAHARFVAKANLGAHPLGLGANGWILLLQPPPHPLRVLLGGAKQS